MTREEFLKLAIEARLHSAVILDIYGGKITALTDSEQDDLRKIEHFAALIAAAAADRARQDYEREHCRHVVPLPDALRVMIDEAVAAERDACAKVCEEIGGWFESDLVQRKTAETCSAAIRARGEA